MSTFIVTIGDETHEVGPDAIQAPKDFVVMPQASFDATIEDRIGRERRKFEGRVDASDLLADDDFFQKAARKRGIELDASGKVAAKLDPDKVRELQSSWEAEHLRPLKDQNEELLGTIKETRRSTLSQKLVEAARKAGVRKEHLESIFPGATPAFIAQCAEQFEWHDDKEAFYFKDPTGNPVFSPEPKAGSPFAGPEQFFDGLRKRDKEYLWFADGRPDASGFDDPGPGNPRPGSITRDDLASGNISADDLAAVASGKLRVR